ncbi:MAG: Gfo/Idh/MocA family oxidoreductase [Defluviitaleaceae bacterium]|nr:Gfo/Idh/MocA family oxidoreductase [Defluviitaleaceae bacterium]
MEKKVNVGIIGCGAFAANTNKFLLSNPLYSVRAACDVNLNAAEQIAGVTGAAYYTADAEKVFYDPDIDAVFITTRHDSHVDYSVRAAKAGKHVFCEKPMALDRAGCRKIAEAVRQSGVKYSVGYNRGLAPMIAKAKALMASQDDKKMIYHRIQDPFPAAHWTNIPEVGGGRFVGEGCHIFDLLCQLAGSAPVRVYASGGIFSKSELVKIPDCAAVTITFADGSVGMTLISGTGSAGVPKESTEIYAGCKAIMIENFTRMSYFGYEGRERTNWEFDAPDKGMEIEFDLFAKSVAYGTEPPNGLANAARAAVISYMVNESVASGEPIPICEADYVF